MQAFRQFRCVVFDLINNGIAQMLCRIDGNTITAVDTGSLNMFHDARNQDIFAVADTIHFDFLTHQILIDQDRMFLNCLIDNIHKFDNIAVINCNLHTLSAKNIGRTDQYRVTQMVGCLQCFFCCEYCCACRSRDLTLLKDFIKQLSVFSCIYILCLCTVNRHTHLHDGLCQFNGCLAAELNNRTVRMLQTNDILHIFRC